MGTMSRAGGTDGFTVMELLVSIAVAVLLLTIILANFPAFGRSLAVEREAQLIALALRDAEARAIATVESPIVASDFFSPYGVHFSLATPQQYIIFSDAGAAGFQGYFDAGERLETLSMGRQVRIQQICRGLKTADPNDNLCVNALSITFRRPSPLIAVKGVAGGPPPVSLGEGDFSIDLVTDSGQFKRRVVIWTTGAISIESI